MSNLFHFNSISSSVDGQNRICIVAVCSVIEYVLIMSQTKSKILKKMSLIPWIDKADDQILIDKVRPDDKVGPITQLLPNSW